MGISFGTTDVDLSGFDDERSFAITAGFKSSENFAIEASYIDLGKSKDDIHPIWTIDAYGFNFAAVGFLPLNDAVEVFGKFGVLYWNAELKEAGFGKLFSDNGTDISYGFGASAKVTDQFGLVFEYQKFELDGIDVSNLSFGARVMF